MVVLPEGVVDALQTGGGADAHHKVRDEHLGGIIEGGEVGKGKQGVERRDEGWDEARDETRDEGRFEGRMRGGVSGGNRRHRVKVEGNGWVIEAGQRARRIDQH